MGVAGARTHDGVMLNRGSVTDNLKTLQGAAHRLVIQTFKLARQ